MSLSNYDKQVRELELIQQEIILTRKLRASQSFKFFINHYLSHLKTSNTPVFHGEIMELIQSSVSIPVVDMPLNALQQQYSHDNPLSSVVGHSDTDNGVVRQIDGIAGKGGDAMPPSFDGLKERPPPTFSDKNYKTGIETEENKEPDSKIFLENKNENASKDNEIDLKGGNRAVEASNGVNEGKSPLDNKNGKEGQIRGKDGVLMSGHLPRVLIIAPRGFAKSTLCSVFLPLWLSIYGYKKDIFLVSATISLAKELLRKIRMELEGNELLNKDFGELKSDKWTEDVLQLKNGVMIRAKGRGFQIRGFRPDMIICDDLEDEEVIYSKDQRDKMESWFFRTLLPALKPDQNLLYVGTKLHQFSLINKLEQKKEFISKLYRAITNDKSIWEDLFSTSYLQNLRREIGEYAFQAEYQNNPISLDQQPVKPEYIENVRIEGKPDVTCLAIDPAISERETSDYRAFVLYGRTDKGFKPIHIERGKWNVYEQVERIINICEKHKPTRVVIEEVAYQKVFRQILLQESRKRNVYIPVTGAELGTANDKRPRDKVTRLLQVIHLFEQKLVEVTNFDLKEELLSFPFGEHDDMVDALVYSLSFLMNYRKGNVMIKREENKHPLNPKPSYYVEEIKPGVFIAKTGKPLFSLHKLNPGQRTIINYDKLSESK